MEKFLERLLLTNPEIKDVTDVIKYYDMKYKSIEDLVPVDALVSDIYNHVDIKKPDNFNIGDDVQNILLPTFYENLVYVYYNGPPQTLYERYNKSIRTEKDIVDAIEKCGGRLYNHIINPSLEVMAIYCKEYSFHLSEIKIPSLELIKRCIQHHHFIYREYKHLFDDINEVITINPKIICYIDNPSDELKIKVLQRDIGNLTYIKDQNEECCEFVAQELCNNRDSCVRQKIIQDPFVCSDMLLGIQFIKNITGKDYSCLGTKTVKNWAVNIRDFKVFNDKIVDLLIRVPNFIYRLTDIPDHYWNKERILILMKYNPQVLEYYPDEKYFTQDAYSVAYESNPSIYPYIPKEFRTETMITNNKYTYPSNLDYCQQQISNNRIRRQWKSMIDEGNALTQELCDDIFEIDPSQFKYIPAEYQTADMICKIKRIHPELLRHVTNLTKEICEDVIKINQNAIEYIPPEYQTEEICKLAIKGRGSNLRWCHIITKDMINIILKTTGGPRKNRFDFVKSFNESDILRIIPSFPSIIKYLNPEQQTDTIIRKALNTDGYCYQYVINKCHDYLEIALTNQPKAIKYA